MTKPRHKQTFILVADGFEEEPVGIILTTLREAGLNIRLVGLRAKQVSGVHGLKIVPDLSLDRLLAGAGAVSTLILPQGESHLARLKRDPRLKILADRLPETAVCIGLGLEAEQTLRQLFRPTIIHSVRPIFEGVPCLAEVTQRLTQKLLNIC